ncbi:MAG: hypothetical protein ACRD04_11340 [Terriglobales bacterium]
MPFLVTRKVGVTIVVVLLGAVVIDAVLGSRQFGSQGCVDQGQDRRFAAPLTCGAQRSLSWKSNHEPHFWLIGNPQGRSLGLAWPPYLVYNAPAGVHRWRMFRVGVRYDRNWRGYIFPTIAFKFVTQPLRY